MIEILQGVGGRQRILKFIGITNPREEKTYNQEEKNIAYYYHLSLSHFPPPPALFFFLLPPFQKSSISLDILYFFLFKAMFQFTPRIVCSKVPSIVFFYTTVYFKSYFRFEKQSGTMNMVRFRTTSFIYLFLLLIYSS